jgi:hypothetical protein
MWVLMRLGCTAAGFIIRYFALFRSLPERRDGISERVYKSKNGEVIRHCFSVPFERKTVFAMTAESGWDGWFKAIGLSREFQTGDPPFDAQVYIASDHPLFCRSLRESPDARALIVALLKGGARRIWSDGRSLLLEAGHYLHRSAKSRLIDLKPHLDQVMDRTPGRFADGFAWRALIVESFIYALLGYAAMVFVEFLFHDEDVHFRHAPLYAYGAVLSGVAGAALFGWIVFFLKRSSRSHRLSSRESPVRFPDTIRISGDIFASTAEGQLVEVEIGHGWLGIPWFRSIAGVRCGGS